VRILWVVVSAALLTACSATQDTVDLPSSGSPVSDDVRKSLESRWHGVILAAGPDGGPCPSGPAALVGDFNSDGRPDAAVRLAASDGPHVAVALTRLNDVDVRELTIDGKPVSGSMLVEPRGAMFRRVNFAGDDYFGADTVVVTPCDSQQRVAFIWGGESFTSTPLASRQVP
jgi:hypothetical protein